MKNYKEQFVDKCVNKIREIYMKNKDLPITNIANECATVTGLSRSKCMDILYKIQKQG